MPLPQYQIGSRIEEALVQVLSAKQAAAAAAWSALEDARESLHEHEAGSHIS